MVLWTAISKVSFGVKPKIVVTGLCIFCLVFLGAGHADFSCPVHSPALQASVIESRSVQLDYIFDPDIIDHENDTDDGDQWTLLNSRVRVREGPVVCRWMVDSGQDDHTVKVTVTLFTRQRAYRPVLQTGDCWKAYDGGSESSALLGTVCAEGRETTYRSSHRSLFLVFVQGGLTGHRSLRFRYQAEARETRTAGSTDSPLSVTKKLAIIFSTVAAALGVCFLVLKFTSCCRPCRKRWCPQCTAEEVEEEGEGGQAPLSPRQLTSLTPSAPHTERDDGFESLTSLADHSAHGYPSAPSLTGEQGFGSTSSGLLAAEVEMGFRGSSTVPGHGNFREGGRLGSYEFPGSSTVPPQGGFREGESSGSQEFGGRCWEGRGAPHLPPSVVTQFPECEGRGEGGGGEGGGVQPLSGFSRPPPAYEALFGDVEDAQK